MLPKPVAALGLIVCLLMALHMMLGPVRRARFDAWLREMRDRAHKLLDFRGRRREARRARAETDSLIRRVKASNPLPEGDWDDNVFRPKQFEGDKRKLH
ncbi:hypothetical protein ABT392_01480 [Paucibacter sp. JuS9]|uniref:hypothetical protein n=1 Tax=Roseateles TaxID=93681 RepID=UPI002FE62827